MPWKHNNVYLREGVEWTHTNGTKHPKTWGLWSDDYKKNTIGLTWEEPSKWYNSDYYYGWKSDGSALLPKPLADIKAEKLRDAKREISGLLSESDWYVTRKYERDVAIPSEITAYRTAVLTNYTSLQTAINSASDIAGIQSIYTHTNGASQEQKTINGNSTDVVSATDNTITISNHGFVDDEAVVYNTSGTSAIGGLVDGQVYYVCNKTTNNFKLSESHSNCGDASAIDITAVAGNDGKSQTLTSRGVPGKGQTWPNPKALKYDGS